tara:strand:+ start:804 stop:1883 length:1080 start_codon:yes stop_codon:yes gene_type:complete
MLLSSLFITFLLEYFLTPAEDSFDKYLSRVIYWVRLKLDVDDKKIALLTWLVLVLGSSLALWAFWELVLMIHPVLAFVFLVVFLYLNLGFKRFINVFLKIHSHLKNEEIEQARLEINEWSSTVNSSQVVTDAIKNGDARQIAREATKLLVLSMHRNLFAPIFWLVVLPGPVGVLLYRSSLFVQREWNQNREEADNSDLKDESVGIALEKEEKHTEEKIESRKVAQSDTYAEIASRGFFWFDWLPARFTALVFAIVGNFEDAFAQGRLQATEIAYKSASDSDRLILAVGEGAMMLSLTIPTAVSGTQQLDNMDDLSSRPELLEPDVNSMKFAIGLMWRSLILCMVIFTLVSFGYFLRFFY